MRDERRSVAKERWGEMGEKHGACGCKCCFLMPFCSFTVHNRSLHQMPYPCLSLNSLAAATMLLSFCAATSSTLTQRLAKQPKPQSVFKNICSGR